MNQHLLATKIQLPPLPPRTVQRVRLLEALDQGLQPNIRVTLLSAPAGYGKTTLLSAWAQDWAQRQALTTAWLSVSEGDNDPARFLAYLAAAFEAAGLELGVSPSVGGDSPDRVYQHDFLIPLINRLGSRPDQIALILDDYHLIHNQTVHDLTAYLLAHLPPQVHLYIATRADPPLPLARLRGRGQVNELRMADLRFRLEESGLFLERLLALQLSPDDIQTLHQRTEGWVSGLQMAAASLRGQADPAALIRSFSGSHHYIMDYLLDEVLRSQSEEMQTFLLQTSILERLSTELCDAVMGVPGASPSPALAMLRDLESANLFIVPLDDRRQWYRYHRLFADLLQVRLQQEAGDLVGTLHRRAAQWLEQQDLVDEAVRHALQSGDTEYAAGLVEAYSQGILLRSETTTFLDWVQRLPERVVAARPKLAIYRAWALLLQGAPVSLVEDQIKASRHLAGPPGSSESLEAMILLSQGQIKAGLARAESALDQLPPEEIYLHDFAAMCVASALISLGDVEAGIRLMDESTRRTRWAGNRAATVTFLCELAELRLKQLQLDAAEGLYRRALDIGAGLPISGRAMMGLGDIALERFDLANAERLLVEGIELTRRWSLIGTLNGYLTLAMLHEAQGRDDVAQETLATLEDLARRFDASEFDDLVVDMLRAAAALRRGQLDVAGQWIFGRELQDAPARRPARYEEDILEARLYKYELPIVARWHLAHGRHPLAREALTELAGLAERDDRPYLLVESYVLLAKVCLAQGRPAEALDALQRAVERARPARSRRIFLIEGDEIIALLRLGQERWVDPAARSYAEELLGWIEATAAAPTRPTRAAAELAEPLSARELDVLRLLPTDMTATALAAELTISVNTVRSHLKNIYAKLGVHSRHEAVAKAMEQGLL